MGLLGLATTIVIKSKIQIDNFELIIVQIMIIQFIYLFVLKITNIKFKDFEPVKS